MGHKISPKAMRLGYIKDWDSRWFSPKEMPVLIAEDFRIRSFIRQRLKLAAISRVGIERTGKYLRVNLYTARPGVVIGKKGADIENLRQTIENMTSRKTTLNVLEIKRPELDAQLVSEGIALQLEKQVGFRRAMKRAIERAMASGALGIKTMVSGRLGGAEIARTEWMKEGRVPLQTFRADIDYGFSEAHITMGRIGVKVWIFKKELFQKSDQDLLEEARLVEKERLEEIVKQTEGGAVPVPEVVAPIPEVVETPEEAVPGIEELVEGVKEKGIRPPKKGSPAKEKE